MSNSQVRPFEEIVVLESRILIKEFFLSSDKKWGESEKVSENRRNGNKVLKKKGCDSMNFSKEHRIQKAI